MRNLSRCRLLLLEPYISFLSRFLARTIHLLYRQLMQQQLLTKHLNRHYPCWRLRSASRQYAPGHLPIELEECRGHLSKDTLLQVHVSPLSHREVSWADYLTEFLGVVRGECLRLL